jgi:hypothetical protein
MGARTDGRGMTTTTPHGTLGGIVRRSALGALVALVAALGPALQPSSSAGARLTHSSASYGWPVKPFDRAHPVRGSFGDPRTIFAGPPNERTLLSGPGAFQFHFGVDVSAPDGTQVYPVVSGRVVSANQDWLAVGCDGGRTFEYWHITPKVSVGAQVEAGRTVLGRILKGAGHVHLTERDGGVAVNPLAPGHLGPYSDRTTPRVEGVSFRRTVTSADLMPDLLRGRVEIAASAYDLPALHVPGAWHDLPVTPALVTWRIERATTHKVVVPERAAYDVRRTMPSNDRFWSIYARGTHQNMCVFGKHFSYLQPGRYLFRLAPGGFDTKTLPDDVYELIVTATDIRGNSSSWGPELDRGAHDEAAAARLRELDPREAALAEHAAEPLGGVVEDRHLPDDLVAEPADRALEPVPGGEARDDGSGAELSHPPRERLGVGQVVEEAQPEHDLEGPLKLHLAEVAADELDRRLEALEPGTREVEHRLGEVDADVGARAVLEHELGDPARPAADVEHPRRGVRVDDLERDVAAGEQARPRLALEEALLVVEAVKRQRRPAKVPLHLRGRAHRVRGLTHRSKGGTPAPL